ncbi:MAG: site-2 protease family protein [Thermoguttaceae bacterium]|nr:site-2 protease family protein [Thermoguttaceae bacterium]MDW8078996.1 site-2 protease family protein [Thermoguttaceae bacterium]
MDWFGSLTQPLAALADSSLLTFWWNVALVLLGLNLVILVHELGHFLVAKWFNVKCEKFYVWFDIFGLRFFRFRLGETEYGLGVLPLGGYVKMLGQEDNPARLREEIERAKRSRPPGGEAFALKGDREESLFDPRSFLAQSVPRRMAIISAGVLMNVVFAFAAAVIAFSLGVEQQAPTVGAVFPGEAAWRAGIRPGDNIEKVGNRPISRFTDLQRAISVGDVADGVKLTIRRPVLGGEPVRLELMVHPDRIRATPTIGVTNGFSTQLDPRWAFLPDVPTAESEPPLLPGDRIVAIEGQEVNEFGHIHKLFAQDPDRPLRLTVERLTASAGRQTVEVVLQPRKVRHLGLVMKLGPVVAVQEGSPAREAGIAPGDRLVAVDGQPIGDPIRLPELLRKLAQSRDSVDLSWENANGRKQTKTLPLRQPEWFDRALVPGNPTSIPMWGLAFQVLPEVAEVIPDSPAAKAGIRPGAVIREVRIHADPQAANSGGDARSHRLAIVDLSGSQGDWTFVHFLLQDLPRGAKVELVLTDGSAHLLEPVPAEDWFLPDRGLVFATASFVLKASSLISAVQLGAEETWSALTFIIRTLQKLGMGQVSPRGLAGPIGIAHIAYYYASEGLAAFLIFLCLLSANLAVLNFIPIPILDGGHMLFLTYEAIRGKPPSESVVAALTFAGLVFLLTLMIWATGMDFLRIFGNS